MMKKGKYEEKKNKNKNITLVTKHKQKRRRREVDGAISVELFQKYRTIVSC